MDENYLELVRKSLYRETAVKNNQEMNLNKSKSSKKIKFSFGQYNSENVFVNNPSEKLINRQSTPFKRTRKKKEVTHYNDTSEDNSFEESTTSHKQKRKLKKKQKIEPYILRQQKKRKFSISYNTSDSPEDDSLQNFSFQTRNNLGNNIGKLKNQSTGQLKFRKQNKNKISISYSSSDSSESKYKSNYTIIPSTSELEHFQTSSRKKAIVKHNENVNGYGDFNFNEFFNSREISFNESVTEGHSGIDYEFLSEINGISNVNVSEDKSNENYFEEAISDGDFSEDTPSECGEIIDCKQTSNEENVIDSDLECSKTIEIKASHNHINSEIIEDNKKILGENNFSNVSEPEPLVTNQCNFDEDELLLENSTSVYNVAEYYNLEDSKLVVLKENCSLCFYGLFTLKVLYGKVDILGSNLDENSGKQNLYSPRGSALLTITNITETDSKENKIEINKVLQRSYDTEKLNDILVDKNSAILECTKLTDVKIPFIEKYIAQQVFPTVSDSNLIQAVFEPKDNWNKVRCTIHWDNIIDKIQPFTKLMFTGGKGVGKSTFLRYAINRLLNRYKKVRVIDLDPGQSEFTIPGCISVITITEPVFGPNYTHLKTTDTSLLSNINVGYDPESYIKTVELLAKDIEELESVPTLINYMGFVQGLGLKIISAAITFIQPTDVVQIQSKNTNKNFMIDLTINNVKEHCDLFSCSLFVPKYALHKVPAMNDENSGWSLEPRQAREMCVLAYFGQMMTGNVNSLISDKLPMYEGPLGSIKLLNLNGDKISPAEANGNLVALCSSKQDSNFVCLGHGIIRGIDQVYKKLVLLTPINRIEDVSYVIVGSVSLPPSVYMTPDDVRGCIPYVMKGELVSLGQITKRSYIPVNKK